MVGKKYKIKTKPTIIIAEAGVNHNGCIDTAKKLINVAADAEVDYVKFQTFKTENLVSVDADKAEYQIQSDEEMESQFEMLKKLELDANSHKILIEHCRVKGIKFLSTAFDLESIDLICALGIDVLKIPSGELTNLPYLQKIASKGKSVILSTGMSTLREVSSAVATLMSNGLSKKDLTILHCNTEYPTPMRDVNLKAMLTIADEFSVDVGYSDHTLGIEIPMAAVALGASCIEKHFTLDREMDGPDHKASLEPDELKSMVTGIRNIEIALGDGVKQPSDSEIKNIPIARKSIFIVKDLKKGHTLLMSDMRMIRPGTGISPMLVGELIGRRLVKDLKKDSMLSLSDLDK